MWRRLRNTHVLHVRANGDSPVSWRWHTCGGCTANVGTRARDTHEVWFLTSVGLKKKKTWKHLMWANQEFEAWCKEAKEAHARGELFATEKKARAAVEAMAFEEEAVDEAAAFEEEVIDDEEVLDDEEEVPVEEPAAPEAPDAARHRVLQRCMTLRLIYGSGPRP